jgi:hypothetical protein
MRGLPNGDTINDSMEKVRSGLNGMANRYYRLSKRGKTIIWYVRAKALLMCRGIGVLNIALIIAVIIITPHRIALWMNDLAVWIRESGPIGILICCLLVGKSTFVKQD